MCLVCNIFLILLIWVFCLHRCLCTAFLSGAPGGQKAYWTLLQLDTSHCVGAENWTQSSGRTSNAPNCWVLSLCIWKQNILQHLIVWLPPIFCFVLTGLWIVLFLTYLFVFLRIGVLPWVLGPLELELQTVVSSKDSPCNVSLWIFLSVPAHCRRKFLWWWLNKALIHKYNGVSLGVIVLIVLFCFVWLCF